MRKGRQQRFRPSAALRAVSALLFVALASQLGQAQQAPAPQSDSATIDGDTLSMPAGVLKSAVTRNRKQSNSDKDAEEPKERGYWYSGFDFVSGAQYAYTGGSIALNGDLSRDGFHVRAYGSWVGYDLNPGHGQGYQTDLMLGYRLSSNENFDAGLYIGADYQNYTNHPFDPTQKPRGTEWGFKVVGEVEGSREKTPYYYALNGEYSTSFNSYWTRARVGLNVKGYTFGPEGIAEGDVGFDAQRVGAFLKFDVKLFPKMSPLEVGLDVGHQFVSGRGPTAGATGGVGGGEGAYGGLVVSVTF
jgi:hypothetical protein